MDRDSRAEARKAWRQIRSSAIRYDFTGRDLNLLRSFLMPYLESLARREYEAGYAAGHEDQMRCRVRDALDQKGEPCHYCCGCEASMCLHTKLRCEKCVRAQARRRG